ncbi:TPA: hypothetical protein U5E38_001653 [Yersinia enterocolitica]|nr:hypothetical protein [Yersinia enterocolitica]
MKFFLVWECFDEKFNLLEKGYHFLNINDIDNIDIHVGDYVNAMAEARDMNPFYFVVTSCHPMPTSN